MSTTVPHFLPASDRERLLSAACAQAHPLSRSVDLIGPAGRLEALVNEGAPHAPYAALLCHPHPLGGGTLHNKVVYHAMKALNDPLRGLGWPVLRFNFRGVGLSQGKHDGDSEADDVQAALEWLENEYQRPLVMAGFSFGAAMALSACCGSIRQGVNLRALVALGLPIHTADGPSNDQDSSQNRNGRDYSYPFLADCALPKLFLSGECDQYAPVAELRQLVTSAAAPKQLLLVSGADHFFANQLEPMQQALTGWLKEQLL